MQLIRRPAKSDHFKWEVFSKTWHVTTILQQWRFCQPALRCQRTGHLHFRTQLAGKEIIYWQKKNS